jgi:tetratricopeptide (TPR) repeat protein/CHAT domain-containing protein
MAIGIATGIAGAAAQTDEAAELTARSSALDVAGKLSEAVPLAEQALALREKALGSEDPLVASSLNGLARLYGRQGRYTEAEPLFKRALDIREKVFGASDNNVAITLIDLANLYQTQGRYSSAEPLYNRVLPIYEKSSGARSANVAMVLNNLSMLYKGQGRYADSEKLLKDALAIREQLLGPDHPEVATVLSNLASVYDETGRYREAEPLYQRSLDIREKTLGPDSFQTAQTLNNFGNLRRAQGQYDEAIAFHKRALAIREKLLGPDHPDVAQSLFNLGAAYVDQGSYSSAEPVLKRGLAIREKVLGPDHPEMATALNNLASLYAKQGRNAEAEALYKRSMAIRLKVFGPDHPDVARALNSLVNLYKDQGRYAEAEPMQKRSLEIMEKAFGPDNPNVASALIGLANLSALRDRMAEAEPLYKRALEIQEKTLGPDHPSVALTISNLAAVYRDQGRQEDATPLYRRSLAIREKTLGPDHPDVAATLLNLGNVYSDWRVYEEAENAYLRALAIREKAFGPDDASVAPVLDNLGVLYTKFREFDKAEPVYMRSLKIADQTLGPHHPDVVRTLNNVANFYRRQERYAEALPLVERLIAEGQAKPAIVLDILLKAKREGLVTAEKAMDEALSVVQHDTQTSVAAAVSKLAARLATGNGRLAELVRNDQDLTGEAVVLDKAIVTAVAQKPAQRDPAAEQRTRGRLAAISTEQDTLRKTLAAEFPDYEAFSNPAPLAASQIQSLLSGDEAVVIFAVARQKTYAFVLTRDRADWVETDLDGNDDVSEKIAAFRHGLDADDAGFVDGTSDSSRWFNLGTAHDLYYDLFENIEPLIKDKKQLLIVPSGALSALPFQLLVTDKPTEAVPKQVDGYSDAAWLIKRQAIAVLPSVASLKALRAFAQNNKTGKPMIGFGDPVFNPNAATSGGQRGVNKVATRRLTRDFSDYWKGASIDLAELAEALPQLPDTAVELKAIAAEVGAPTEDIHLSRDASETTVKQARLSDYQIVYFATHALVAGDIKGVAEPSLVLSIPAKPTEFDDGLLTASEVAQLKLDADWVVLSACNTIAGDKPGAEALSGLARAFFYAGARALLVSHWSVDSTAATRLTTSTFAILKSDPKLGRAEALRQAMLKYLGDKSSPENAYPGIWGPFEIIGESRY